MRRDAELAERIRRDGPFEGACRVCGQPAFGLAAWVEVDRDQRRAMLVVPASQRHTTIAALHEHLDFLATLREAPSSWLTPEVLYSEDGASSGTPSPDTTAMGTIVARAPAGLVAESTSAERDAPRRVTGEVSSSSVPVAAEDRSSESPPSVVSGETEVVVPDGTTPSTSGVPPRAGETPGDGVPRPFSPGPIGAREIQARATRPGSAPARAASSIAPTTTVETVRSPIIPPRAIIPPREGDAGPPANGLLETSSAAASTAGGASLAAEVAPPGATLAARPTALPKPGRQNARPTPPGGEGQTSRGALGPSIHDAVARAVGVPQAMDSAAMDSGSVAAGAGHEDDLRTRTFTGRLAVDDGVVTLEVVVDDERARGFWGVASLRVRPIHLREFGYPLVGVRVIASYVGRVLVVDAVLDVGSDLANEVLTHLSRDFRVQLVTRGGGSVSRRDVEGANLERNAALCLESARAALAATSYPRDAFAKAVERLSMLPVEQRLTPVRVPLAPGDFRHLVSPREVARALEFVDKASERDVLAELLEVDGLPVTEFEAIRRRVLSASVGAGLLAPQRFWRRITSGGLAADAQEYVEKLTANRGALEAKGADGDDLDPEQRKLAWRQIFDFAQKKGVEPPPLLLSALQLRKAPPRRSRGGSAGSDGPTSFSASGEIAGTREVAVSMVVALQDPESRLAAATAALQARRDLEVVAQGLGSFSADELVGLAPHLVECGTRAVPALLAQLSAESREVRQLVAIVLGAVADPEAISPLLNFTLRERTAAWQDGARALGSFGARALPEVVETLTKVGTKDLVRGERLARTLAEVALADDEAHVRALFDRGNEAISRAATRALATMEAVRVDGQRVRGEHPLHDDGSIPSWACRLHDAISAPELADVDLEESESEDTMLLSPGDLEVL